MKRLLLLLVLLLTIPLLPSCQSENSVELPPLEVVPVDEYGAPHMIVIYGNTLTQATRGTTTWDNGEVAICADSMHPLDGKDYMALVPLQPSILSHVNPYAAYLQFPMAPDSVEVRCWDDDLFGQMDRVDECETVAVKPCEGEDCLFEIQLKEVGTVYEVIAEWNLPGNTGGTCYYSFYTSEVVQGEEIPATEE